MQSDIAMRLARIEAASRDVFGESHAVEAWLRERNGALGGRTPLSLLDSEKGCCLVESILGRIADGIVE